MFPSLSLAASTTLTRVYGRETDVSWRLPDDLEHGDATTTVALSMAKTLGKPPREIAEALAEGLRDLPEVTKAEVAGAGYVNVWLTSTALVGALDETTESITEEPTHKDEAPVIVDYSQPNIAKPLGVHHILSTVIGQTLCNLNRFEGTPVVGWNYLGDWGTQFGKLAVAFERFGNGKKAADCSLDELLELYVKFHEEVENDPTLEEQGRAAFKKLEDGDKTLRAFWSDVVSVTKASLGDLYERLHVAFDVDHGESFFEDKMQTVLDEGIKKGVFVEGEGGALIVNFAEEENLPPFLVRKGDGATLYATRDLAMVKYRTETWHPKAIYHVVDAAQSLYFKQLFATVKKLQWEMPELIHIDFGRMRFADRSMSTRKGNILKLEHVLDEAVARARETIRTHRESIDVQDEDSLAEMMGVGALVYGVLSQNRRQDMVFDWEKMLSFEGNSAPYLMYTNARAKSILRKSGSSATEMPKADSLPAELTKGERELIRALLAFPADLEEARKSAMPHVVANSLFSLCQAFNHFYHTEQILKASDSEKELRLALTSLTSRVLCQGATLLTLVLPDQM